MMDFWAYIANGGLERLLIIGVAALIGYWGYRIYGRVQTPGLALIALAAVVLFSVILTSKQHLETVNDNLLALGTLESATGSAPVPGITEGAATVEDGDIALPAPAPMRTDAAAGNETASTDPATVSPEAEEKVSLADTSPEQQTPDPAPVERLMPLASGQELGGRITSVRSENVTLEWSKSDDRRIIRPNETQ